jgi:outer membrane protein
LGYQVGVRNSVDLVNSQKNYYQTFTTYQQTRYQYLLARVQLRYLSGSVDDKFIHDINANIKPTQP